MDEAVSNLTQPLFSSPHINKWLLFLLSATLLSACKNEDVLVPDRATDICAFAKN